MEGTVKTEPHAQRFGKSVGRSLGAYLRSLGQFVTGLGGSLFAPFEIAFDLMMGLRCGINHGLHERRWVEKEVKRCNECGCQTSLLYPSETVRTFQCRCCFHIQSESGKVTRWDLS